MTSCVKNNSATKNCATNSIKTKIVLPIVTNCVRNTRVTNTCNVKIG